MVRCAPGIRGFTRIGARYPLKIGYLQAQMPMLRFVHIISRGKLSPLAAQAVLLLRPLNVLQNLNGWNKEA
jgi:hypothetical protein